MSYISLYPQGIDNVQEYHAILLDKSVKKCMSKMLKPTAAKDEKLIYNYGVKFGS